VSLQRAGVERVSALLATYNKTSSSFFLVLKRDFSCLTVLPPISYLKGK